MFLICLSVTPLIRSVLIGPGAIQFTVILKGDSSFAKVLPYASTPALEAI